jgi:nucleotide-binding universal stress UspA family protein
MESQNLFEKIVVPLDGSPWAERAIPHAEQIARSGGELILVYVYKPAGSAYLSDAALADQTAHFAQARQAAEVYAKSVRGNITSKNINVRIQLLEGADVAAQICEFVNSEGADLVVMPTAGHNRLMNMFLGDLTARVRGCINACLLLVRGDLEAEWDKESRQALEKEATAHSAASAPAATAAAPTQLLEQLGSLRDAGIVTADEFETKKAEILKRV